MRGSATYILDRAIPAENVVLDTNGLYIARVQIYELDANYIFEITDCSHDHVDDKGNRALNLPIPANTLSFIIDFSVDAATARWFERSTSEFLRPTVFFQPKEGQAHTLFPWGKSSHKYVTYDLYLRAEDDGFGSIHVVMPAEDISHRFFREENGRYIFANLCAPVLPEHIAFAAGDVESCRVNSFAAVVAQSSMLDRAFYAYRQDFKRSRLPFAKYDELDCSYLALRYLQEKGVFVGARKGE